MNTRFLYFVTLAAMMAACSSTPSRNAALDQARSRYNAAQSNSQVTTLAPNELKHANDSLVLAEQAWNRREKTPTIDHLAYLANQRVTIAQDTASSRASQAITASAAAERDQMRLAMRTKEADTAHQQLALSQESNALKTTELAEADANAVRERAQTERSNDRVNDLEMQLKELNAKKTDRGLVVTLGDVLFDTGKSRLLPGSENNMSKLAAVFKRNPQRKASVDGYTDNVGTETANYALSQRRANSVMTALTNLGVPSDRLSTHSYGEENPAGDNSTAAGRQMNRRVEIVFAPLSEDIAMK